MPLFKRRRDAPEGPLLMDRLFLGAGAMKAGTTWLYSVLGSHPEIFFSVEKEIHYFYARSGAPDVLSDVNRLQKVRNQYMAFDPARATAAGIRARARWVANYLDGPIDDLWYRNLFLFRGQETWAADFSNLYALLPEAEWRRLHGQVGDLRVLYTMRHPVERLWSHLKFHLIFTGRRGEYAKWGPEDYRAFLAQPFIWDHAEYGAVVRRLRAALPERCLTFAFHEDIHADELAFLRRMETRLGIAPHVYDGDHLRKRVNLSGGGDVPPAFADSLADYSARVAAELRGEGLVPPASWTDAKRAVA